MTVSIPFKQGHHSNGYDDFVYHAGFKSQSLSNRVIIQTNMVSNPKMFMRSQSLSNRVIIQTREALSEVTTKVSQSLSNRVIIQT